MCSSSYFLLTFISLMILTKAGSLVCVFNIFKGVEEELPAVSEIHCWVYTVLSLQRPLMFTVYVSDCWRTIETAVVCQTLMKTWNIFPPGARAHTRAHLTSKSSPLMRRQPSPCSGTFHKARLGQVEEVHMCPGTVCTTKRAQTLKWACCKLHFTLCATE